MAQVVVLEVYSEGFFDFPHAVFHRVDDLYFDVGYQSFVVNDAVNRRDYDRFRRIKIYH